MKATFRDILKTPSNALEAMLDGLEASKNWDNFRIQMKVYAYKSSESDVCYGCAASCTVLNLYGYNTQFFVDRYSWKDLADTLDCDPEDLKKFEQAIDNVRYCSMYTLGRYFGVELDDPEETWYMSNNWESSVLHIRTYIERLKALGL